MECSRQTGSGQEIAVLAESLRRLLEEQVAAGREGDLARVEQLGGRADAIVAEIARHGGNMRSLADGGAQDLEKLYGELILMLRTQQADVQGKLRRLRRVRKAIGTYGGNAKTLKTSSLQYG